MADFNELIGVMKKAALDAVEAAKPAGVFFGTVESASPLKINVEQKLTLTKEQLVLTRNVTEHEIEMTVNHYTENETEHTHGAGSYSNSAGGVSGTSSPTSHRHAYTGRKKFLVHNGLIEGEEVILIRMQNGQKFLVVDRLGR